MYVVDASVVAKWVLPGEPFEENALLVKTNYTSGKYPVCAPSLLVQEIGNSLWKAIKRKRITQENADKSLKNLSDLGIALYQIDWTEISKVLQIAEKTGLTIYDASYLFLSKKTEAPVITADDKMFQKAKDDFRILHLRDYV